MQRGVVTFFKSGTKTSKWPRIIWNTLTSGKYIIPYHAVVKHVNNKIKLRVVTDASAYTSTGPYLNIILFSGPKLQGDIMDLLIYYRLHRYMFKADICKMYHQIIVSLSKHEYQHILLRNDPLSPLEEYELCTVIYGVASLPFHAIKVLHQFEQDEEINIRLPWLFCLSELMWMTL